MIVQIKHTFGTIWMKPIKVMCNIAELLIKYTEERTIIKPFLFYFLFYLVFYTPPPHFECLVHIVLLPKVPGGQDSTVFILGHPAVPHKVFDWKQLSVDVYSLG